MLFLGFFAGLLSFFMIQTWRLRSFHALSRQIIKQAEKEAKKHIEEAERHEKETALLRARAQEDLEAASTALKKLEKEKVKHQLKEQELLQKQKELSKKSALTEQELKASLLQKVEREVERESLAFRHSRRLSDEKQADAEARNLLLTCLLRLPAQILPETYTKLEVTDESIIAKIIGKEGKNIKAFQELSGVQLAIEKTSITLSCFNPQRREVAHAALLSLIQDGKINPITIQEALQKASNTAEARYLQVGSDAADKASVERLHPELLKLLGKMQLLSSFGQNLLSHSLEVSELCGLLAAELKLNTRIAKRIGLLHDIGKAVSSNIAPTHALAGYKLALQYGESEEVANGIGCHHNEMPPESMEAMLCKPADALSASRIGARFENGEHFFNRLQQYEEIAKQFPGVETAFALQAGRKLQVFVKPEVVDDLEAVRLARQIADKIEGKVTVTVIRQTQAIEYIS